MSKKPNNDRFHVIKQALFDNKVILLFCILCIACLLIADTSVSYVVNEVATRFGRNTCLVLALIIPCLAGLGMNFGIVAGAMAAQIAIFFVVHYGFKGISGFLLCTLVATPLAVLFGWLLGRLFNKTKGAEMIAGLVFGFFADGLYRLFVLYIIGGIIPYDDPNLLPRGFGLRNAFDLTGSIKYTLDDLSFLVVLRILFVIMLLSAIINLIRGKKLSGSISKNEAAKICISIVGFIITFVFAAIPYTNSIFGGKRLLLSDAVRVGAVVLIIYSIIKIILEYKTSRAMVNRKLLIYGVGAILVLALSYIPEIHKILRSAYLASFSYGIICLFCFLNNWLLNTKLGQDMRTVGQSRSVATSAGINVDRTRIVATCLSTVLAAWGQLIFLQNLGTFNTVQQQSNVGLYAVAAILVGGANVQKANNKQAIIGVLLFHTLFVVAPLAATKLVGDSAVSEYIRMFISYGVIAVALAMHAWKTSSKGKKVA